MHAFRYLSSYIYTHIFFKKKQLRNAESRQKYSFPGKNTPVIIYQVVTPEIINIQRKLYIPTMLYLNIEKHIYIHVHIYATI